MKKIKIFTDGGARGNPGPAAFGIFIKDEKENILYRHGEKIGIATNNQAEYQGLIEALKWIVKKRFKIKEIDCFLDSKLVVCQMTGLYKVKSKNIIPLWQEAKQLETIIKTKITYHHILRHLNHQADSLLNQALDL